MSTIAYHFHHNDPMTGLIVTCNFYQCYFAVF